MDEEDGRPGHSAAQTGHLDAFGGVPKASLCRTLRSKAFTQTTSTFHRVPRVSLMRPGMDLPFAPPQFAHQEEIEHENLPGK